MSQTPNFLDNLAKKADELELQRKAKDLVDAAARLAQSAFEQAKGYAHENQGKVEDLLDKAAAKVDEQTEGKYHDKVVKARASAASGFQRFAEGATPKGGTDAPAAGDGAVASESADVWEQATDGGSVGSESPRDEGSPLA